MILLFVKAEEEKETFNGWLSVHGTGKKHNVPASSLWAAGLFLHRNDRLQSRVVGNGLDGGTKEWSLSLLESKRRLLCLTERTGLDETKGVNHRYKIPGRRFLHNYH